MIDKSIAEVKRYLKIDNNALDDKISEIYSKVLSISNTKCIYKKYSKEFLSKQLTFGSVLTKHLTKCDDCYLFCATLGAEFDGYVRRLSIKEIAIAAIADSCASVILEEYCDECMNNMGSFTIPRFSPGYSDFPITEQKKILELLEAGKRIGVFLTDSYMMAPSKTVTAVVGITDKIQDKCHNKCLNCTNLSCEFRKSNK